MMSGNSPFISKTARYNFLSRSVRLGSKHTHRAGLAPPIEGAEAFSSSPAFSSLPPASPRSPTSPA